VASSAATKLFCFAGINLVSVTKPPSLNFHFLLCMLYASKEYTEMPERKFNSEYKKQHFGMQKLILIYVRPERILTV
jgi:hypothetical protein